MATCFEVKRAKHCSAVSAYDQAHPIYLLVMSTTAVCSMSSSWSIAEFLSSLKDIVGVGTTAIILLATTFFFLKKNEGENSGSAASSGSVLEQVEELDGEVSFVYLYRL